MKIDLSSWVSISSITPLQTKDYSKVNLDVVAKKKSLYNYLCLYIESSTIRGN